MSLHAFKIHYLLFNWHFITLALQAMAGNIQLICSMKNGTHVLSLHTSALIYNTTIRTYLSAWAKSWAAVFRLSAFVCRRLWKSMPWQNELPADVKRTTRQPSSRFNWLRTSRSSRSTCQFNVLCSPAHIQQTVWTNGNTQNIYKCWEEVLCFILEAWRDRQATQYTGCPRRNVPDFRRVFLMLKYTDITQNTYVQSWTVTEIMAREV